MSALPVPTDGWPHLLRMAGSVTAGWAIAAFTIVAFLLPGVDPQCQSANETTVCPQHPDPALTHLFDAYWPQIPVGWPAGIMVVSMLFAIGVAVFIDSADPWSSTGGAPQFTGLLAGILGCGVGLFVAGPGFTRPLIALAVTALGALLILLALLCMRGFRGALRRRYAVHLRRQELRQHGTRTVATITELVWERRYLNDDPVFTVAARLGDAPGARIVSDELCVPSEQAPVVGGTVVVIHDKHTDHPTDVTALIEADPAGLRDPNALEKYPPAPEDSPS
ncbi:hypothetical protein [Leucobacter sp. GX24907]